MLRKTEPVRHTAPKHHRSPVRSQAPRLAAHIPGMRAAIARAAGVSLEQVNVKAKTAERLGPVGQGLAIEARAAVLICAD